MASVDTTNAASRIILMSVVEATAYSLAAAAMSPIGALGGVLFGAVRFVAQIPLIMIGQNCLNSAHPCASSAAKALAKALQFFGSIAAAWAALALAGFSLGLSHIVILTLVGIVYELMLALFLNCMGMDHIFATAN